MYVVNRQAELGVLRIVLEEQYERHSTQLALLARQARRTRSDGADVEATSALTAATRRALGDIARALHYLEQGHYGTCQGCGRDIPIEELAHRPAARYCAPCQPGSHRRSAPPAALRSDVRSLPASRGTSGAPGSAQRVEGAKLHGLPAAGDLLGEQFAGERAEGDAPHAVAAGGEDAR